MSGYVVASTIGFARVINNKHWVTDVVAGAGIGILSTKISYFAFERLKLKRANNKKVVAFVSPYYNTKSKGLRFKMLF
nr:phosphatase PAP2 family protein [Tenuifilum sp.]